MAKRSSIIDSGAIAEAAAWFAEFRAGEMTAGTRARFDEWLRQSPEHIQAYLEVSVGWSELPTADPDRRIDVQALIGRARASEEENIIPFSTMERTEQRSERRGWKFAVAASIAALAILIGAPAWIEAYHLGEYSTGVGEQRTLSLADGSTVILNALTTVRVRYSEAAREVDLLRGQAYFHDTQDLRRPFVVRSGGTIVRAIGTQFDVYRKSSGTVVTVVEGRVAVADRLVPQPQADNSSPDSGSAGRKRLAFVPVLVSAGQQVIVTAQVVELPKPADIRAATAWVERRLVFDNTPLADVAAQFNLYSSRRLVIADPGLRALCVSGVYSSADPESLIGFLRAQQGLRVIENPKEITVSRRE